MSTDLITPAMKALLTAASDSLTTSVALEFLAPGAEVADDNCCEGGGQLWVRLISAIPAPEKQSNCAPRMLHYTLGVGVTRCAHVLDDNGVPPSAAEMTGDAEQTVQDQSDLMEAILCAFDGSGVAGYLNLALGRWDPRGPLGGCVGGEWTLTLGMSRCRCPEKETP